MSETEKPLIRLSIGVPSYGEWKAGFGHALSNAISYMGFHAEFQGADLDVLGVLNCNGTLLPEVRHQVVTRAIEAGATHLMALDSDMVFPPDAIARLLSHGKAVVGANYVRRKFPCYPTAYCHEKETKIYTTPDSTGLEQVGHMGLGCVLFDLSVFDLIEPPWFQFTQVRDGWRTQGEDVHLFKKLHEAGVEIWIDHDLSREVQHIGEMAFTHEMALTQRDLEAEGNLHGLE